jgi:glycosyltransferase involved in cell wall biosynthesis
LNQLLSEPVNTHEPAIPGTGFPRLVYIGDVPVEGTVAGMALLYRLLQRYPAERLKIIESDLFPLHPEKRLEGVAYETLPIPFKRLLFSRLSPLAALWLWWGAARRAKSLRRIVDEFRPEAVLTVAHGFSWLTASGVARKLEIPLHLIIHDDALLTTGLPASAMGMAHRVFQKVYRSAASRLCVSPYMAEIYKKRYGVDGTVIYPSRAANALDFGGPAELKKSTQLTFVYAGSLAHQGYVQSVADLAKVLGPLGHRLVIYAAQDRAALARQGLDGPHVSFPGLVPFNTLAQRLREEADVLFVPMVFDSESRSNMEVSFPSKLADYTLIGLPLLIQGPDYASAVRWGKTNTGTAEVVDRPELEYLTEAVRRLENPTYRAELGRRAWDVGNRDFSYPRVIAQFYRAIGVNAS